MVETLFCKVDSPFDPTLVDSFWGRKIETLVRQVDSFFVLLHVAHFVSLFFFICLFVWGIGTVETLFRKVDSPAASRLLTF